MSKIYLVTNTPTDTTTKPETFLVRANTKAGALNRIAEQTITAKLPTQDELLAAREAGVKIIDATGAPLLPGQQALTLPAAQAVSNE